MEKVRIKVKNLTKSFKLGTRKNLSFLGRILHFFGREKRKEKKIGLNNISFEVKEGEILGITGPNGSGKSTLLRIIAGIIKPDKGEVITNGKIVSLINLYAGLKERLTMKENIYLIGSLFSMSQKEINKKYNSIVNFSELKEFENEKVFKFSNGMMQRLVFSVAIHAEPDILLLDEVFEVGDEEFRKKSSNWIREFVKGGGSVILVSHDMELIKKECGRVINF